LDQKFEVTLFVRGSMPVEPLSFAKQLFAEMEGCTVSEAHVKDDRELRVKMCCFGMDEPASNKTLRSFVSILTERRTDLRLGDVRSSQVGGVHHHVSRILGPAGGQS
jgi:hypothetical protein